MTDESINERPIDQWAFANKEKAYKDNELAVKHTCWQSFNKIFYEISFETFLENAKFNARELEEVTRYKSEDRSVAFTYEGRKFEVCPHGERKTLFAYFPRAGYDHFYNEAFLYMDQNRSVYDLLSYVSFLEDERYTMSKYREYQLEAEEETRRRAAKAELDEKDKEKKVSKPWWRI